jgi:hypothetical protein
VPVGCVVLMSRAGYFYAYILINVWRMMEDQSQRTSSGIHYVRKSARIRVIRGIRVLSFFDGSILLRVVVMWGDVARQGIYL